jgi:HEAT repeats
MNLPQREFAGSQQEGGAIQAPADYGKLGPGADVTLAGPEAPTQARPSGPKPVPNVAKVRLIAIIAGIVGAMVAVNARNAVKRQDFSRATSQPGANLGRIGSMQAQKQAESLLELAIGNSPGAVDQIFDRVDSWRGKLTWNSRIANLTTTALNANDMRVREAGIEVEIAAYNVSKDSSQVDSLVEKANGTAHDQKIWALWTLGLLGNRRVDTDRVVATLADHLKDPDVDSRRWAVDGLALVGTTQTIAPLLRAMHDDPAASVRESAACGIAQAGMFTPEQRMSAVPQLVSDSDDPGLDAQTHAWAFQALGDITHQHLPNDSAAWRDWYEKSSGSN